MVTERSRRLRAARSCARTTFRHRCPACGTGPLFEGRYRLFERCPDCGQDLVGADGAQYGGPIVLGYTVAGISGLGTIALLWWRLGYASWQLWAAIAVTCLAVFLTFRHCKGAWTWLLWATGQLGDDAGGRSGRGERGPGGDPDDDRPDGPPRRPEVRVRWLVRLESRVRADSLGGRGQDG
jgi:uncharacterized protein (DUF983 family)